MKPRDQRLDGILRAGQASRNSALGVGSHRASDVRSASRKARPQVPFTCEELEPRALMTFAWSAEDVYLSELVNRARANPAAEGARLGINLAAGLSSAEQARLVAQQPLALNIALTTAASDHALDMRVRGFFDHLNPDGKNPTQRAAAAGYSGSVGENIAAGYSSIDLVHKAWLESVGHRKNVLSLWSNFDNNFHYDEFGPGIQMNVGGTYNNYFSQSFGVRSGANGQSYLLGVVTNDLDSDQFYDIGEGLGGVRVDVAQLIDPNVIIATTTTPDAGNYQLSLPNGAYRLTFTQTSTGKRFTADATLDGQNVKVDARLVNFALPVAPDEHANSGNWLSASNLPITSAGNAGTATGALGTPGDTDLFKFAARGTGNASIKLTVVSGNWNQRVRVFDSSGRQVGVATAGGFGTYATVNFSVTPGATYFALADAVDGTSTGQFLMIYEGPAPANPNTGEILAQHKPAAGVAPILGKDAQGRLTMSYLSQNAKPVFAVRNDDGTWTETNLAPTFSNATYTGQVVHWTDANTQQQMVAARNNKGLAVFRRRDDGTWVSMNIVTRTAGSVTMGFELTALVSSSGYVTLTGRSKFGDLIAFTQLPQSTAAGSPRFIFTNITGGDVASRGMNIPDLNARITAWTTNANTPHVAAIGPAGELRLFWKSGTQKWNATNLSQNLGLSVGLYGNLSVFQTSDGVVSVMGTGVDGRLYSINWRSGIGWRLTDLTATMGGQLWANSLTTWADSSGQAFVSGIDAQGRSAVYRYTSSSNTWTAVSLSYPNAPLITGFASALRDGSDGSVYMVNLNVGGELVLSTQAGNGTWGMSNLSVALAA